MAVPATRPRLQARAITEIGPLAGGDDHYDNQTAATRDLGRGTHASMRGSRIAGGTVLADGTRMPVSPFLPLPPPPTAGELNNQEALETPRVSPLTQRPFRAAVHRLGNRSTSAAQTQTRSHLSGSRRSPPSSGMIRSYSVPVATEQEYEEQKRTFAERDAKTPGVKRQWSEGWPSTPGIMHPYRGHTNSSMQRAPMLPLTLNKTDGYASTGSSPRTACFPHQKVFDEGEAKTKGDSDADEEENVEMLSEDSSPDSMYELEQPSPQDTKGSYFAPKNPSLVQSESPSEENSDGPDTPRASTPAEHDGAASMQASFSKAGWGSRVRQDTVDDEINGGFIHPDHLVPPSA